jgi:hypothetical protein
VKVLKGRQALGVQRKPKRKTVVGGPVRRRGIFMAGMSAWCVLADTLRSSLDFSLVAGDMQGVIAIIRDHKDLADQAQIAD